MLSGFNTNIRHRSVLFHVQSEDSGRAHPHIITHLYHGGTILKSEKSSYADRLGEAELGDVVKGLMESQHKAVLKKLTAGEFDALIQERLGADVFDVDTDGGDTGGIKGSTQPGPPDSEQPTLQVARVSEGEGRSFGSGIVSERPLDEVILDYLVENARKRKRPQK